MPLLPQNQGDQTKLAVALIAGALAVFYYMYPYATRAEELEATRLRVEELETANAKAAVEAKGTSARQLAAQARTLAISLDAMKQLVPAEHEVPGLLEQVSTAARRAGLDICGVAPETVLSGDKFDSYC